jgi:hypothetical protein
VDPKDMKQLQFFELDAQDMKWLARLDRRDFAKTSSKELLEKIAVDDRQIWRFRDKGIFITWKDDFSFWVDGMAGDGLRFHAKEIAEELTELAGDLPIRCIVYNKALENLYTKHLGYTAIGTILEMNHVG